MTTITTQQAANHLRHAGLKPGNIPIGRTVQFGPHKGTTQPYYFLVRRVSQDEWVEFTTYYFNFDAIQAYDEAR